MALENTSAASECTNELTSVTQCEDVTSETVIQEKSSSESKSSHLENKQLSIKNDVKNLTALESMVNTLESCVTLHGFYFTLVSFSFCKYFLNYLVCYKISCFLPNKDFILIFTKLSVVCIGK